MARSNVPQALSVVSVTREGDVARTVDGITKFDGADFGFSHAKTWASMPAALRGVFQPEQVLRQITNAHPRVAKSIAALCSLGLSRPVETHDLRNYPDAGIKPVQGIRLGPNVMVAAKATCWHVSEDQAVIPILQPRLDGFSDDQLGIYAALARLAFCQGDWAGAAIEIIDLSGPSGAKEASARVIREIDLPVIKEERLTEFLKTYAAAQLLASEKRSEQPKKKRQRPTDQQSLFDSEGGPERIK